MFIKASSLVFIAGILTAALISCDGPVPEPESPAYPYRYYPLDTGKYIIYQVDSIIYNETFANDTTSWQVMEMLADTFYDLNGRLNYRIDRFRRTDGAAPWQLVNTWQVMGWDGKIEKVENNLRFIKLATFVMDGWSWDGHAYLGGLDDLPYDYECNRLSYYEGWTYTYTNLERPFDINGLNFENTITVLQEGDSNLIWFDQGKEVYAEHIGMVYKEFFHFYTQDITCPTCPWEERVECGYSVKMSVLEYN